MATCAAAAHLEYLEEANVPYDSIDAGLSLTGLYLRKTYNDKARYMVSFSRVKGYRMVGSLAYKSWLSGQRIEVYLLDEALPNSRMPSFDDSR
jgi:hypothetical protein